MIILHFMELCASFKHCFVTDMFESWPLVNVLKTRFTKKAERKPNEQVPHQESEHSEKRNLENTGPVQKQRRYHNRIINFLYAFDYLLQRARGATFTRCTTTFWPDQMDLHRCMIL